MSIELQLGSRVALTAQVLSLRGILLRHDDLFIAVRAAVYTVLL